MVYQYSLKHLSWTVILLLTFVILLLSWLLSRYYRKMQNMKYQEARKLVAISLEAKEHERRRIAEDFHDGVNGDLHAIRNYLALLSAKEESAVYKKHIRELMKMLNDATTNIQYINNHLIPPAFDQLGLVGVLQDYFENYSKWKNVEIYATYSNDDIQMSAVRSYELYRIIQELIHNMTRHGKATRICLSVEQTPAYIKIQSTDNGLAFNFFTSLQQSKGIGLRSITNRLRHINGELFQQPQKDGNLLIIQLENTAVC